MAAAQTLSAGFAANIAAVLDTASTDPGLLILEVTESVLVHDERRAPVVLAQLGVKPGSETIVTAIIQLAHGLGMTVVSEGVETAEQHDEVTELGSDLCQGFYFARPMTAPSVDALIQRQVDGHDPRLPPLTARSVPSIP
ncbi:MAG: EAL domain-containing protein [Actinomycetota bacterium]|nr:EAL domain-containing protein [Actinomycetota bacterium]